MGQYYKAVNIDECEYLSPHSFNCGAKLMESCYVGNDFVNALTALLSGHWHDDRVMYIGDYAWDDGALCGYSCSGVDLLRGLKEDGSLCADPYVSSDSWRNADVYCPLPEITTWVRVSQAKDPASGPLPERTTWVNRGNDIYEPVTLPARKGMIDCDKKRYVVNETQGVFYDRDKLEMQQGCDLTQDPLLIFLAVGSGLGGGDYHRDEGAELVGSWACQTISASNERPEGLREIANPFDPNA